MRVPSLAVGILAAMLIGAPSLAFAESAPQPGAAAPSKTRIDRRVESRIKALHKALKITASEEPQWAAVADAMREDAAKVGALIRQRRDKAASMNAVDDLRTYQAIAEAHAEGVRKLVTAFEALYSAMPPAQQKIADAVFAKSMHRHRAKKPAKE